VITDEGQRVALSNLGWVDHGAVWRFDSGTGHVDRISLGEARHLVLQAGRDDLFAAVHHFDGSRLEVTVQCFSDPEVVLGRVVVTGWRPTMEGDSAPWDSVPAHFVGWLNDNATGASGYYRISIADGDAHIDRLDWFDANSYDLMYQSVIAVASVPENRELVYGLQRSSHLVVVPVLEEGALRRVALADRNGNAVPYVCTSAAEVWVVDYDTVVRLDRRTWEVTGSVLLQEPSAGTRMFVGDLWMPSTEDFVLIPRPGSGDVALVNPRDMTVSRSINLGRQPLTAAVVAGNQLVARDWKTGNLLLGNLI